MSDLPDGWEWATLGDLGDWYGGGTPSKSNPSYWEDGKIPWVSPKDMSSIAVSDTTNHITEVALENSAARVVPADSVIFVVRSGILTRKFPVSILEVDATLNQDMKAIHPKPGIDPRWLAYFLQSEESDILQEYSKAGTTVASLDAVRMAKMPVPLPPMAEQRRIVDALENNITRASTAQRKLSGVFRRSRHIEQSLIDQLLVDVAGRSERPLSELLAEPMRNGHSAPPSQGSDGVRTLTLTAVTNEDFSDANTKLTVADPKAVEDLWLSAGDIFIQRSNTRDLVGTSAVFEGSDNWSIFPDLLVRIRVSHEVLPRFVQLVLRSQRVRSYLRSNAKGLAGSMPKIDQQTIGQIPVPVPTLTEQEKIVCAVAGNARKNKFITGQVKRAHARSEQLRRSLLRAAFTGRLVPQDPDDEPASLVLERIRSERESASKAKAPRKKRARKSRRSQAQQHDKDIYPSAPPPEAPGMGTQDALELDL